jgi:small subunit ribosomal protein S4
MGDPRTLKKKYKTPIHPWQTDNIEAEKELRREFAFKNKQEIWRVESVLKGFKNQAKKLIVARSEQAEKEKGQLMKRLERLNLIQEDAHLDTILGLTTRDVAERRLQSIVFRKGLARSMKQARQFITHNHVLVAGKKITAPSYLVTRQEEHSIEFSPSSAFIDVGHPERSDAKTEAEELKAAVEEVSPAVEQKDEEPSEEQTVEKETKEGEQ